MEKINRLSHWLEEVNTDIAFVNNPSNIMYLTNYSSNPHERILSLLISTTGEYFMFAPALEVEEIKKQTGIEVYGYKDEENPWQMITDIINEKQWLKNSWAIEKDFLTVERFESLQQSFPDTSFDTNITNIIREMMLIKSQDEINKMIEAGKFADYALEIGFKAIKEGVAESEIIATIEYELKKKGISQMSFDTLVLAGDHAASPHGTPGSRQVESGEFILFDLGVVYNGYTSDVTRTVVYGEVSDFEKEVYDVVLRANLAAIAAVKPGITAGELDVIARDIITEAGYGEYFIHRLGHGLGSSVHEFPSIMTGSDLIIQEGMCFSIEPGIYIPNKVGVRIEDCVYVTKEGCEVLTHTPKELLYI